MIRVAQKVTKSKKPHNFEEEMNKIDPDIRMIISRKDQLSTNEVNIIFDFLLEMCQNA